jgi:hypothetical protein
MPHFFCQEHGQEQEARCREEQENYRRFGEAVLIVSGPVKSPSHRCRACNLRLRRGQCGYVATAFPRHSPKMLTGYDYAAEGEYLVLEYARATLYGAESPPWPPSGERQHLAALAVGHELVPEVLN